jgi:hypothetical protein
LERFLCVIEEGYGPSEDKNQGNERDEKDAKIN